MTQATTKTALEEAMDGLFQSGEAVDLKMKLKTLKMLKFLLNTNLEEELFIRLNSNITQQLQRLVGGRQITDDGTYALFLKLTDNKWSTAEIVGTYERCAFAVDFLSAIFVIGEIGRSAATLAQDKDADLADRVVKNSVLKVGKHLVAAALTLIHSDEEIEDISGDELIAMLIEEVDALSTRQNTDSLATIFPDTAKYGLFVYSTSITMIYNLNSDLKATAD